MNALAVGDQVMLGALLCEVTEVTRVYGEVMYGLSGLGGYFGESALRAVSTGLIDLSPAPTATKEAR